MGMSLATIAVYSTGLFLEPLEREFGWSRAELSFGMTIYSIVAVPLGPFVGRWIDRWGARRIAIPGVIIFGAMFASLSLVGSSIMSWWGLWVGIALASLGISPTLWIAAVSSRFEKSRGLAIALSMCGTAISSFFTPLIARWLIDLVGWRSAYAYIGLGWSALALLLVLPFFFDARDRVQAVHKSKPAAPEATPNLTGLTFQEAMRNRAFQKLGIASLLVSLSIVGTVVHLMPILGMRGLNRETAAGVLSILGIASALGKLGTGWLFDRVNARPIAAICLALPAIPLFMLAISPLGQALPAAIAVALLGFAAGAELSATAYLTTRYVGLRAFAQNYAIISCIMAFSAGVGPFIAGLIYDSTGSYGLLLFGGIPVAFVAGLFIATMGPFPVWQSNEEEEEHRIKP
jgi:MFS family permease